MADGRTRNRHQGGERAGDSGRDAGRGAEDRKRAQAAVKMAKALGNDEMLKRVSAGRADRDAMLAYLVERLRVMRTLQVRELRAVQRGAQFSWWQLAADPGKSRLGAPDPSRWRLPAQLYERAAEQLCRGDLRAGREILEKAIAAEQEVRDALTRIVDATDLGRAPDPSLVDGLAGQPTCGPCDAPTGLGVATDIQLVSDDGPDIPQRRQRQTPWWTDLEDEDEEEDDGGG